MKNLESDITPEKEISESLKQSMITRAQEEYGEIRPTNGKETLEECFSVVNSEAILWFNVKSGTTCIIKEKLN